ncbi:hypothetical protein [Streptomyces iakyrus]|uniref:hypothetical protein n=1 Tax=Streptomyces iakyrus TaxID=68219 RepID=UPI003701CE1C
MKFIAITLIVHRRDPVADVRKPTHDRFREVLDNTPLAEKLGFVGAGTAGILVAPTSQQALAAYRPVFEADRAFHRQAGLPAVCDTQHRDSPEPFQSAVAPVLRNAIPDPPFVWGPVLPASPTEEEPVHV